jgi:hypothetical protein
MSGRQRSVFLYEIERDTPVAVHVRAEIGRFGAAMARNCSSSAAKTN